MHRILTNVRVPTHFPFQSPILFQKFPDFSVDLSDQIGSLPLVGEKRCDSGCRGCCDKTTVLLLLHILDIGL